MTLLVDPPSGWMYGFPKVYIVGESDLEQMLRDANYPEKDIQFAINHSRFIGTQEEINELKEKNSK